MLGVTASSGMFATAPAALVALATAGVSVTIGNGMVQVVPTPEVEIVSGFEPGEVTVKEVELQGNSVHVVLEFKNTGVEERNLGRQWFYGGHTARLVDEATSSQIWATNFGGDEVVSRNEDRPWWDGETLAPGKSLDRWWTFEVDNPRGRQFKLMVQGVKETFDVNVSEQ